MRTACILGMRTSAVRMIKLTAFCLCLLGSHHVLADYERVAPETGPWRYNMCQYLTYASSQAAECANWKEGTWGGYSRGCYDQQDPAPWDSEAAVISKARKYPNRATPTSLTWLQPGEIFYSQNNAAWCYEGWNRPTRAKYKYGVDYLNYSEIHGADVRRSRSVTCPAGSIVMHGNQGHGCYVFVTPKAPAKTLGSSSTCCGNPIDQSTGNKYQTETDYVSSVAFGLRFERTHNSMGENDNAPMGARWTHRYDRVLQIDSNEVKVPRADGKIYTFANNGGSYTTDADINATLSSTGSGYTYLDSVDNVELYNSAGQLISITNKAGLTQTLIYDLPLSAGGDDDSATLDQIADSFGRTLTLTYDTNGRIASMTDPAGEVTAYAYDSNGNLETVTRPDTATRIYHYENAGFAHALTGITNENGNRFATWTYDSQGRATSSEHAGGVERVTVAYHNDGSAVVTDSFGQARTYSFNKILDVKHMTNISGGPCADCGDTQSAQHDTNGNATQRTDFNGNVTNYAYDSRNLEISRTEAVGTPQERIITAQWHSQFRLPVQIDHPGQRTTYTYDNQGRLLTRTITDTANNNSRTTTYSYDTSGLVDSIDGPRNGAGDITTYSYDNQGNRISTSNALGHATQVTGFNAHGQATTLVDTNGVFTELTYDVRRRLTQRVVAPNTSEEATTTYQYDGVGNLTQITLPDNSSLTYEYDLANRLTAVQDNLGNRIEYTLDLQGNRVTEQTKDPGGTLRRQIQRAYDNLNRLQQVTGIGG